MKLLYETIDFNIIAYVESILKAHDIYCVVHSGNLGGVHGGLGGANLSKLYVDELEYEESLKIIKEHII